MTGLYERTAARDDPIDPSQDMPVIGASPDADEDRGRDQQNPMEQPGRAETGRARGAPRDPGSVLPSGQSDEDMAEGSDPAPDKRRASVQRTLSGQSTALRGMLALGAVVLLGGLYLFTPVFGGWSDKLREETVANPLVPDQRVGTGLMVAAASQGDVEAKDPLVAASAPDIPLLPNVQSANGDIDGLLARLDERQARLDKLTGQLTETERARDAARRDVDRLGKELKTSKQEAAIERKTHDAEIRALKQQHKLEMARAIADAMARMPVYEQQPTETGLSPEELRLLEERRRLRAAQLRSKSIVYDGVTE